MNTYELKKSQFLTIVDLGPACLTLINYLKSQNVHHQDVVVVFDELIHVLNESNSMVRSSKVKNLYLGKKVVSEFFHKRKLPMEKFTYESALEQAGVELWDKLTFLKLSQFMGNTIMLNLYQFLPNRVILCGLPI